MTNIKEIKDIMSAFIPLEMRSDEMISDDIAKVGAIDMAIAVKLDTFEINEQGDITPTLTLPQLRLASYFAYGVYLQKLKLLLNNDAINFSTLTFSIKGLEKRPEMIDGEIYRNQRYKQEEIDKINGSSSIVGQVSMFGGGNNG